MLDVEDIGDVKLSTHAYDRILERKIDITEIDKVLKKTPTYNEKIIVLTMKIIISS